MGYCSRLASLLLLALLLVEGTVQLDCSIANQTVSDKNGDFVVKLDASESGPRSCQIYVDVSYLRFSVVSVTNVKLTGSNKIIISQSPDLSAYPTKNVISAGYKKMEMQMKPMGYFITFDMSEDTKNDHFEIMVAFDDLPVAASAPYKISRLGAKIQSSRLSGNDTMMIPKPANPFLYTVQIKILTHPMNLDAMRNVYVFAMNQYRGTIEDYMTGTKADKFVGNNFAFLNTNSEAIQGFEINLVQAGQSGASEVEPRTIENRHLAL